MTAFKSRWADWQPGEEAETKVSASSPQRADKTDKRVDDSEKVLETPQERTDKTDKSPLTTPSVSFVSPLTGESENFSLSQARAISRDDTPKVLDVPKERTDKTDKSPPHHPSGSFVGSLARESENFFPEAGAPLTTEEADTLAALLLRYESGDFSPTAREHLAQIFRTNPPDAEARLLMAAAYLGVGLEAAA